MDRRRRDLGKFRHRVELFTVTRVADEGGGNTRSDPAEIGTLFATVWGSWEPATGREVYWNDQLVENITHSVKIRWRDDVEDGMFIKVDGTLLYVILAIDPTNLKEFIFFACREGGPG